MAADVLLATGDIAMKILTATAAAVALYATASYAQDAPSAPSPPPQSHSQSDGFPSVQPPPPPELDSQRQADAPDAQRGDQMMHHRGPHGRRTASISVEAGGAKVRVRCGADQSSNECVDMVMQLLDRVQQSAGDEGRDRWRDRDRDRWDRGRDGDRYGDRDRERRWRD